MPSQYLTRPLVSASTVDYARLLSCCDMPRAPVRYRALWGRKETAPAHTQASPSARRANPSRLPKSGEKDGGIKLCNIFIIYVKMILI